MEKKIQGFLDIASNNPEGEYVSKDFNPYPEPICSDKFRSHDLKTTDPYFSEIVSGNKTFEVRINDRDFRAGDLLILKQYDNKLNCYTGNHCFVNVTFILQGGSFGIHKDYVVMSIKKTEI